MLKCVRMTGKSKKGKKGEVKQTLIGKQAEGMQQTGTPPTVTSTFGSLSNTNFQPSSLIRQSNELLYGNAIYTGLSPSPPVTSMPVPVPQQLQTPAPYQGTGPQAQFIPNSHTLQPNYNDTVNPYRQQIPQQTQLPQECPTNQLTSVLQSLDSRLSKIETQLGYQTQQMGQQNNRILNIEQHVEQITVLKQNMSSVNSKVYTLETDMKHIKSKQTDYDSSIDSYSSLCDSVLKSQSDLNERVDALSAKIDFLLTSEIEHIKTEHNDLKEDFLDSKCRQMCENLIFTGIHEVFLQPNEYENCENTLREFLSRQMNIQDDIKFDRVHRLGRFRRNQGRPRPIIAKFHDFKTKEMVKRKAPETLKDTPFGIREQYPDEYERRRKVLYPKMKAAKTDQNNHVRMVKDTLFINSEKYICGQNDTPVKVVYQSSNSARSQNYKSQTVSNRSQNPSSQSRNQNFIQNQPTSSAYVEQSTQRQTQQRYGTWQTQPTRSTPREPALRDTFSRNVTTGRTENSVNFESRNMFTSLPLNDYVSDRSYAGKTKASSPLEQEAYNKKHREDVNEQSFMELTPSPEINSPTISNNSILDRNPPNFNTSNINTVVPTQVLVENPQVNSPQVIGAECHENPELPVSSQSD